MHAELESTYPNLDIEIFAINMPGAGSGTQSFTSDIYLPMVQDDNATGIWSDWGAAWRDVYILDQNNELVEIFNLTQNGLNNSSNYDSLMQIFIDTASQ